MTTAADVRSRDLDRAQWLTRLTIGWNTIEGVVAVTAGALAGSISLVGFGIDSAVEVSAAVILAWRLRHERRHGEDARIDRVATKGIAVSLFALAVYVSVEAVQHLVTRSHPERSFVGIGLAVLSLIVMPLLVRAKRRVAPRLGSSAVAADASQTIVCAYLSAVLLIGLIANATLHWWWADPVAGLVIALLALREGWEHWTADTLDDACCA